MDNCTTEIKIHKINARENLKIGEPRYFLRTDKLNSKTYLPLTKYVWNDRSY